MLKQMLERDWDAKKMTDAKEKNRGVYRVNLALSNKSSPYIKLILTKMTNRNDGLEDSEYQEKILAEND